jgi:hypothetical protein
MLKARLRKPEGRKSKTVAHDAIALTTESAAAQEAASAKREASHEARPQSEAVEVIA